MCEKLGTQSSSDSTVPIASHCSIKPKAWRRWRNSQGWFGMNPSQQLQAVILPLDQTIGALTTATAARRDCGRSLADMQGPGKPPRLVVLFFTERCQVCGIRASRRLTHPSCSEALNHFLGGEIPGHGPFWLQDRHFVTQLFLSLATRGLGAFLGTLLEDVARTVGVAASMPRTRNLWELVGPPAAPCPCKSEQAHSTPVPRTVFFRSRHRCAVSDDRIFHARFHLLQHPGCRPIELSEAAPDCKTPLGPGHAVGSLTQIDVTAEYRECSNLFRIDMSLLGHWVFCAIQDFLSHRLRSLHLRVYHHSFAHACNRKWTAVSNVDSLITRASFPGQRPPRYQQLLMAPPCTMS